MQQEQPKAVVKGEISQKPPVQPQPVAPPQHTGLQQPQHVQQPPAPQACSPVTAINCICGPHSVSTLITHPVTCLTVCVDVPHPPVRTLSRPQLDHMGRIAE